MDRLCGTSDDDEGGAPSAADLGGLANSDGGGIVFGGCRNWFSEVGESGSGAAAAWGAGAEAACCCCCFCSFPGPDPEAGLLPAVALLLSEAGGFGGGGGGGSVRDLK